MIEELQSPALLLSALEACTETKYQLVDGARFENFPCFLYETIEQPKYFSL